MNILFLSLVEIDTLQTAGIYQDLLRALSRAGHYVCAVSPTQRRNRCATHCMREEGASLLRVKTGNIQKTNLVEKGISTLCIEGQFKRAIKKHFKSIRFDLVLYSTPPVTFAKVVRYVKKRDGAQSYLLLKDIFPQNAVDIGLLKKSGIKGLIWRFFRRKERTLYALSDRIGCMSEANVRFLLAQDPEIDPARVEICPNSIEPRDLRICAAERRALRAQYGIPQDKTVFVYGGNLGKPQGVDFVAACVRQCVGIKDAFFLIVGDGTEYGRLSTLLGEEDPANYKLLKQLPKADYDRLVGACDVGLIFLDYRFTIPNFPSRLLSYMQAELPVLAATDPHTDVGDVITRGGFGLWCESNDVVAFANHVKALLGADRPAMGALGKACLLQHYTAERGAEILLRSMRGSGDSAASKQS